MKIEPSGVIFTGICQIRTPVCRARQPAPLTAVWGTPRVQIDVCTPCLNEMIRRGEWQVPGARVSKRYDTVVYSPPGRLSVIVQVQTNGPDDPAEASAWARMVHLNLRIHGGIGAVPFFFLVGYPEHLFVWRGAAVLDPFAEPTDEFHDAAVLQAHGFPEGVQASEAEQAVAAWLEALASADDVPDDAASRWIARTGLLDAIRGGSVVRRPALAA